MGHECVSQESMWRWPLLVLYPDAVMCMQAPMLAGEMENMYAAPISSGQWAGSQGGTSLSQPQLKSEQAAPTQDSAQGGQTGPQDSSAANMSDQMLQILEQLKKGG